jgi:hypothetical protein
MLFSSFTVNMKTLTAPSENAKAAEANQESDGYKSWEDLPGKLLLIPAMNMKVYDVACVSIWRKRVCIAATASSSTHR